MTLTQEVCEAGKEIISSVEATLSVTLNHVLGRYIGWPLKVRSGYLVDRDKNKSDLFASVIYAATVGEAGDPPEIPSDNAAVVIDACESLTVEMFLDACSRIAKAKRLKKSPPPRLEGDVPVQTTTLGIVFAISTTVSLDRLAHELVAWNTTMPSSEWPDMLVVATSGTINYFVQFPGEPPSGDLLPPPMRTLTYTPPMYVVVAMMPTGPYTFNRLLGFLLGQLFLFSPGVQLPDRTEVVEHVPKRVIIVSSFQYNLKGELVPVPRELCNDRYWGPQPVQIEDKNGKRLCTLRLLPWQDGATILSHGKLALAKILPFLIGVDMQHANIVKREDSEISYVLPMTETDFARMLDRIQSQSNMVVRVEQPKWTIQKVSDEGTQTAFIARLFLGVGKLRDLIVSNPDERDKFDSLYEVVLTSLRSARKAAEEIARLWQQHSSKVTSGEVARLERQILRIDESIDDALGKEVVSFVTAAGRTIKEGMQKFIGSHADIGFLFQKQAKFETGLLTIAQMDSALADYLRLTRAWSEPLQECRNDIEHRGWTLPRTTYVRQGNKIEAVPPLISGQPVTEFVSFMLDRVLCFVEELTAYRIQRLLPDLMTLTEIPPVDRAEEAPVRFQVTVVSGGLPPWRIIYHHDKFDDV